MKPSFRRYRRRNKPSKNEGSFFKKEGKTEAAFFGEASPGAFFQPAVANQAIQRKCDSCEKEDKLQRQPEEKKEEEKKIQRVEDKKEEDKKLQKKEAGGNTTTSTNKVSAYVGSLHGKGNALSPVTNQFFSSRIGYDFSQVRVHTDTEAAESAKSVNAKAYTIGNNIVFNEGQFDTGSQEGKRLLAHELTHVVQQKGGENELDRTINTATPTTQKRDPIPVALARSSTLGKTYIKINGQRVDGKAAIMKPIWEAFEKATLQYNSETKKCVINLQDVNLTISADLIVLTDPTNDQWTGKYSGGLLDSSSECSKLGTVNVQLVSTPGGGAALQAQVAADENEHCRDLMRLSKTYIEAFYNRLSNLTQDSKDGGNDCVKWFQSAVRDKNNKMVITFADEWVAAVDKHDNKSTGTHNRKARTNVTDCKLITITVQL